MKETVLKAINYINTAVNKSNQFNDYSPEMSNRVLDNRIITLEGYIRYIEREALPKLKSLVNNLEEVSNG
ncbi:hypothetical protein [Halanaerobium salsuginis]|jgi:hypothetical protein|uniref:Uncharacterized protein n=1 Tax=Halanaerobium salsuginis TaxID=29563 RepID=A0A1I4G8W3_9FIRM|nr:hypothetical protein [Halanaerobium salsuginis]SFL26485.1 hypothetical protein SAMN02983006_00660 [Halanaerobium salsuginis]